MVYSRERFISMLSLWIDIYSSYRRMFEFEVKQFMLGRRLVLGVLKIDYLFMLFWFLFIGVGGGIPLR
jgi:hypothetical protein